MNIVVGQSGGPTVAINASLLGVYKQAMKSDAVDTVFGTVNGIEGIINDHLVNLNEQLNTNANMELLKVTPSTALGSCRYKLPDVSKDPEVFEKIFKTLKKHDIGAFFYIGGNDSMDTVDKLSKYAAAHGENIKFMGVPKTVDNDLWTTDHTPGFGSAAKYVATTLSEIVSDSSVYDVKSVTIVEIMGRSAGWLTASSCVLRANGIQAPQLIYLPEAENFSEDKFVADVKAQLAKTNTVIVAVSEGIELGNDEFRSGAVDNFGHKYLSGIGKLLENVVKEKIGCKVRSIELNVMQRSASHITSKTDVDEAELIGSKAVEAALSGETGKMMCFKRVSDKPYFVDCFAAPVCEIANKEKKFPKEWIINDGSNVADAALDYFLPLIEGECIIPYKNGMPMQFKIKK